ncbi:MAG: FAD-binding protein [Alphaproteobacteria bacterium]|nr:FAD-binding protein [Alphaproteobacteria bacterium]
MNRRRLLAGMAAAPLLQACTTLTAPKGRTARVRPGSPDWPNEAEWSRLDKAVGGLVRPQPVLAACDADAQGAACKDALSNLGNPFFLGDQAGATQVSGWYKAWKPEPSAYAVAARDARDVAAAVNFARKHRLRLVVKGGGHSYQGTSNAPDSLLVWTRKMTRIEMHDAFVPAGCEGVVAPAHAVSVGAGCVWLDVYHEVTTKGGRYAQGGGCTTVGVAGHIQSGGFGSWSKRYGTAAGNLLEAEVVTADGKVRIVNARRDPELFWALKGGGGGSFGVVTRVTVRTHDLPNVFGGGGGVIKAASDEAYRRLIERFIGFYSDTLFNSNWGEQATFSGSNTLDISMASAGVTRAEAAAAWKPFIDWVSTSPSDYTFVGKLDFKDIAAQHFWDMEMLRSLGVDSIVFDSRPGAPSYHAWWKGDGDQVSVFLHGYESIWLPETLLAPDQHASLADALFKASRHMSVSLHFNKGLAGAAPDALRDARDTATNPDVLGAFALAITATGGPPAYTEMPGRPMPEVVARVNASKVDAAATELRRVAPKGGSYVSESNYFNADWANAFWGANYARLRRAKAAYDPAGLFTVHHGVGSEDWSADGFTPV